MQLLNSVKLIALGTVLCSSAQGEPRFEPESVYAIFTESIKRCGIMYPSMKASLATTTRVLELYLSIDPVMKKASESPNLSQAKIKVNSELDEMFRDHVRTKAQRRAFCESTAKGELGLLQLPAELFEMEKKGK
jgi:hypothetical protein